MDDLAVAELGGARRDPVSFFGHVRDALRLAGWRTPRHPAAGLSGLAITATFAALIAAWILEDLFEVDGVLGSFSPYGLDALVALFAAIAAVLLAFSRIDRSQATARRLTFVIAWMVLAGIFDHAAWHALASERLRPFAKPAGYALWAIGPIIYIWLVGAARRAFKSTPGVRWPTWRAIGFIVAVIIAAAAVPAWPVFVPQTFDYRQANLWEIATVYFNAGSQAAQDKVDNAARRKAEASAARLEAGQHLVLAQAIEKLAPRDPDRANTYAIGLAGWSDQDVFLKEIQQSTEILKARFHLGERTLALINNPAAAKDAPIASMQNLGEALRAVAHRMDRDKDLFVLTLSSHGSPDGFALRYGELVERTLDPETLRMILDAAGIKNRVIIVSSCYSGTFVEPLKTPNTMVLTAASSDRTSFGCSDDRKWTWFGEALFDKALADHATLADAFAAAKATIATWEREQQLPASNPQIFVGDQIARDFPDIVGKAPAPAPEAAAVPERHASR